MPRKKQPADDSEQQELDLGISLPPSPSSKPAKSSRKASSGRIERVNSRAGFTKALNNKGADSEGISAATDALYQEGFDKRTQELYETYGVKPGNRDTLPEEIQDQVMLHEIINKHRVKRHDVGVTTQDDVNDELTSVVAEQTRKNRGFFGWLFGRN